MNKSCGCARGQKCKLCLNIPEEDEEVIPMVESGMTTTAFELPGHIITRNLGVVQGLTVRSRSFLGSYGAAWQAMAGGEVTLFSKMCEQSRQEAFMRMRRQAIELGANAIVGMRYDATEIAAGITEVLAYGTAVVVEPKVGGQQ
jgi:uncharacterized protein YbjQ (UPF0145 family)